ncbi:hypothetical protein [Haliangium sp.]|uniref:hypothetical protein n=1 Tax=Haliangium sp. TaxID=2663208 RepID=UPI003D10E064
MLQRLFLFAAIAAGGAPACLPATAPAPAEAEASEPADACRWPEASTVLSERDGVLHQVWEFDLAPVLTSTAQPNSEPLRRFRVEVADRLAALNPPLGLDPAALLAYEADSHGEGDNVAAVASGRAGRIRSITCLESLLLAIQAERKPMIEQPTELAAFILRRRSEGGHVHLRIYYSTADQPGLKMSPAIMDPLEADVAQGWTFWVMLHNHNFFFDQEPVQVGVPAPSKTDVELLRVFRDQLGLRQAWITNGFHTLVLSPDDLSILRAHGDPPAPATTDPVQAQATPGPECKAIADWRPEVIELPPEFAPSLPPGREELRFAPGMFDADAADYFSYAFVLAFDAPSPSAPAPDETDPAPGEQPAEPPAQPPATWSATRVETLLDDYYRGLVAAVATERKLDLPVDQIKATVVREGEGGRLRATVAMYDPFVTGAPLRLHMILEVEGECVRAAASPQPPEHPIWQTLAQATACLPCTR